MAEAGGEVTFLILLPCSGVRLMSRLRGDAVVFLAEETRGWVGLEGVVVII